VRAAEVRLILAHAHDDSARALARRWGDEALLLTPALLHGTRWWLDLDHGESARVAPAPGARPMPADGVVCRLGGVSGAELPQVRAEDRDYAAAELTAFLLAWLDACRCPVLNRPVAGSLNGPPWHPEQWALAAMRVGLAVATVRRRIAFASTSPELGTPCQPTKLPASVAYVSVVGDRWFGPVHESLGRRLCDLARAARTPLLAATVEGAGAAGVVRDISAWPDVSDPAVADAVVAALGGQR